MSRTMLITGAWAGLRRAPPPPRRFITAENDIGTLVLVARESAAFAASLESLRADNPHGKEIIAIRLDLGDRAALRAVVDELYDDIGNVHVLVNNAGFTRPSPIHQIDFDDFRRTINVNVYAPFLLVQGLLHSGNVFDLVVNIASTAGINGRPGWLTYSASKAAVISMSDVMREELAIYGTRVACISPGRTATDLRRILAPDEDPTTIMQPEDVAAVIEMLSSPVGRFVDSANLVVRL